MENYFRIRKDVKMADQRNVLPLEMVKVLQITIVGLVFYIDVVVFKRWEVQQKIWMILRMPWFKKAKNNQEID